MNLEEIMFGSPSNNQTNSTQPTASKQGSSLEEIMFGGGSAVASATTPPDTGLFNNDIYSTLEVQEQPMRSLGDLVTAILGPLSMLNKPLFAAAGGLKDLQDQAKEKPNSFDVDLERAWEKTKEGFASNDRSFVELVSTKEEREEYPMAYMALGLLLDSLFDPVQATKPAKIVKAMGRGVSKIDDAIGASDAITRVVGNSKAGRKAAELVKKALSTEVRMPLTDTRLPLKRWFTEEGPTAREVDKAAVREASLIGRTKDAQEEAKALTKELIEQGIDQKVAEDFVARAVGTRPSAVTSITADDILSAHKDGTLNKLIIDGQVDVQDAVNTLIQNGIRVPTTYLDDAKRAEITATKLAGRAEKKAAISEIDPYGISIDEKTPKQQAAEISRNINAETKNTVTEIMMRNNKTREQVLAELNSMNLKPETVTFARQVVADTADLMGDMTRGLLDAGVISEAEAVKFFGGSHLRRSYELFDNPEKWLDKLKEVGTAEEYNRAVELFQKSEGGKYLGNTAGAGMDFAAVSKRLNLSEETRKKMGEISNSEYLIGKTGQKSIPLLAKAEYFDDVAKRFGVSAESAKGNKSLVLVPTTIDEATGKARFGALAGMYLPKEIMSEVAFSAGKFDASPGVLQKAVSWWKVGKLLNPATFARNIQSGAVMANVFGEVPSYVLPKYMKEAFDSLRTHNALYKEAMNAGLFHGGITNAELKGILGGQNFVSKGVNKAMGVYGKSDDYWRLAVYGYHRANGKTVEEAVKIANRALFDYDKVPPLLDVLRKNGILPFGAFPYFAAKETARALYKDPASVSKYLRAQWRNDGTEEKTVMPEYLKGNVLMRLGKGEREVKGVKQEITSFLDMTYLLPFSNDISFGPAAGLYDAVVNGKDFLGRDLTPPRASLTEKVMDKAAAAKDIVAPTLLTKNYWDKPYRAATGKPDDKGRHYTAAEAVAQNVLGWKTVNVNIPEEFHKRMTELEIDLRKAKSDLERLRKSADPDMGAIKEREEQVKAIKNDRRAIQKALLSAQQAK